MLKGNAILGQSGGPTSVINASLAGIITAAKDFSAVENVLGMRFGVEGLIAGNVLSLGAEAAATIKGLKTTPSSILGSCRYKPADSDLPKILDVLKKYNIRYMFLIGGNDTMDTICRIENFAAENKYELVGIGVPKTADNDLFGTDHSPGYPSAARYIALSVLQAGILARDMRKVDQFVIFQCIGRAAGWLTAAAAVAKKDPADAPHILCLPERPFEKEKFLAEVKKCYDNFGFVSIVCGEGITYPDGTPVSASQTKDEFSNIEFGAMGGTSAAMVLHRLISSKFGFRGEFQITESLPMCAADRAVQLDIDEAFMAGREAVRLAKQGRTGLMVALNRKTGRKYKCHIGSIALSEVAGKARPMPDEFIDSNGFFVTETFIDYVKPLAGSMPEYVKLQAEKFNPR